MHDTGPILAPLLKVSVTKIYAEIIGESGGGPHEGTSKHTILEKKLRFLYLFVLGKLMPTYYIASQDKQPAVITSVQETENIKIYQAQWVIAVINPVPLSSKHFVYHKTSCSAPYQTNYNYIHKSKHL